MIEAAAVGTVLALLALAGVASVELLVIGGLVLAVGGLALGVPAGLVYHAQLRRALAAVGPLPARWWWSPIRQHARLTADARARFRVAFVLGAAGFAVSILGCVLAVCGLAKAAVLG